MTYIEFSYCIIEKFNKNYKEKTDLPLKKRRHILHKIFKRQVLMFDFTNFFSLRFLIPQVFQDNL